MRNSETKRFGGLKVMTRSNLVGCSTGRSTGLNALPNLRAPKRDLEERLFYRRRASPRFYTAKTPTGHKRASPDEAAAGRNKGTTSQLRRKSLSFASSRAFIREIPVGARPTGVKQRP